MRPTRSYYLLLLFCLCIHTQLVFGQVSVPLKLERINFSSNTAFTDLTLSSYEKFAQDFRFGSGLTVQSGDDYTTLETTEGSAFAGFNINFIFKTNLYADSSKNERRFFTFSSEAGILTNRLYEIQTAANRQFRIDYRAEVFRMAIGYRHVLTKKNRRIKFYTGLELINEFNISSTIRENEYNEGFNSLINERKFFAAKGFGFYMNAPIGLEFRPGKKTMFFFHINFQLGTQNADPLRINGMFTGTRLGISFKV